MKLMDLVPRRRITEAITWIPKGAQFFNPISCPIHLRVTHYERVETMTKPLGQRLYELVNKREFSHGDLEYKEMMVWEEMAQKFASDVLLGDVNTGDVKVENGSNGDVADTTEQLEPQDQDMNIIQNQIYEWAMEQFKDNTSKWTGQVLGPLASFLGMVEEIGEMAHAILYRHQGRGYTTDAEYQAAIEDGLGDLDIFAMDFANREGISRLANIERTWMKVMKRRQATWKKDKEKEDADFIVCPKCNSNQIDGETKSPHYKCLYCNNIFDCEEVADPDEAYEEACEVLLPPMVWCKRLGAEIMDADGWHDKPYHEPICIEEFVVRWTRSTSNQRVKGELKRLVELLTGMTYKTIEGGVHCLKIAEKLRRDREEEKRPIPNYGESIPNHGDNYFTPPGCEQTGQGWAEPPEEKPVLEQIFPEGSGNYRNDWGQGLDASHAVKPLGFVSKEEIDEALKHGESYAMTEATFPKKPQAIEPPYLYGKSRSVDAGTNSVSDGVKRMVIETASTDKAHWTDAPMDGFAVAREIATQYAEGQNRAMALKTVDTYEKNYREFQAQCKHEDPDRTGFCIKCQAETF